MIEFILVVLIFSVAFVAMALALHFSKYKKRSSGCCGGAHCDTDDAPHKHHDHSCHSEKMDFVKKYADANIKTDII